MIKHLKTDFTVVIDNIFKSGLPYSSRKLVYNKMISECDKLDFKGVEKLLGVDIAFDDVYNNIHKEVEEDELTGC